MLSEQEELSYRGIASLVIYVPIGTVMPRLSRARGFVRRDLTVEMSADRPSSVAAVAEEGER